MIDRDRLLELLAAEQLGDLSVEERAELQTMLEAIDTPESPYTLGELLVTLDAHDPSNESLPADLARRITAQGAAMHAAPDTAGHIGSASGQPQSGFRLAPWVAGIAALIAVGAVFYGLNTQQNLRTTREAHRERIAALQNQIDENVAIIAASRQASQRDRALIDSMSEEARLRETELAQALDQNTNLAERLALTSAALESANDRIAYYEEPVDPELLRERRRELLTVPETVQIAWQPFDLPDAPAEQRNVRGDVVWNDEEQRGYIRFQGLAVNDPSVEQYQVWVIDERGLEQKVSGGVFNASAEGEIIVPITPGIDVGRVALFAITVEDPGGTWVPDLSRRVVIAPRDDG